FVDRARNGGINLGAKRPQLRGQIKVWNRISHVVCVQNGRGKIPKSPRREQTETGMKFTEKTAPWISGRNHRNASGLGILRLRPRQSPRAIARIEYCRRVTGCLNPDSPPASSARPAPISPSPRRNRRPGTAPAIPALL